MDSELFAWRPGRSSCRWVNGGGGSGFWALPKGYPSWLAELSGGNGDGATEWAAKSACR